MKKIILSSIAAMALTTSASAFMGVGIDVGTGIWQPTLAGDVQYKSTNKINFDNLGMDDKLDTSNNYVYLNFTHFVPIIPNVRIEKVGYTLFGNTKLTTDITFNDKTFTANTNVATTLDMSQVDYIAYWSVPLLNTATVGILDVNYGLDLKQLTGSIVLDSEEEKFDEMVPLFYLNAVIDIPAIPVKLDGTIKTLSYDGTKISDNEIKASINLPIPLPLIDFKLDIGYKVQNITISDKLVNDLNANLDTKGLFVGLSAKF